MAGRARPTLRCLREDLASAVPAEGRVPPPGEASLRVWAGQPVLRTVSVAVRAIRRPGASVHGHMADSVDAANVILQHLSRSEGIGRRHLIEASRGGMTGCASLVSVDLLDSTQAYVLTVIGHAAQRIRILGVTLYPTGEWATQRARNLIMDLGGRAERMKFMILDPVTREAAPGLPLILQLPAGATSGVL